MNTDPTRRVPIEPQSVDAPLTRSAVFLVLTVADNPDAAAMVRSTLATAADISKNVAIRDLGGSLSCTVGIGSRVWDSIVGSARPSELHPFAPVQWPHSHRCLDARRPPLPHPRRPARSGLRARAPAPRLARR